MQESTTTGPKRSYNLLRNTGSPLQLFPFFSPSRYPLDDRIHLIPWGVQLRVGDFVYIAASYTMIHLLYGVHC